MAESTAKTMLGEISQGHLECPICFCRYKEPKILDCLHTFCLNCLDGMLSKQQVSTGKITCPVCRKETPVPEAGLPSLLDCFFMSSLVDEINQQEQSLETQQQAMTSPTCDDCEEGLEAVWRCQDCEGYLCKLCKTAHERSKRTRTHQVTPVLHPEQREVSSADLGKTYSPKCQEHSNQEMHFYCETCKMMICGTCATIDHRSAEHQLSKITEAVRSYRHEVTDVLQKFQKSKEEFKANEASVEHARNRLKLMLTKACSDIQAKEEEEIAKIKNKSQLLKDEVTKIGKQRDEEFEKVHTNNQKKMEQAEKVEAAVNDLMQQADDFELLTLKPKVMQNLEFQKDLQFERVRYGDSFIGVKCQDVVRDKDFGRILHEEKWKLKMSFGKEGDGNGEFQLASCVCCVSNGDIAVNDTQMKRISVFTSTGQYKTKLDVNATRGLAITPDDQLLVNRDGIVMVHDTNQQVISEFTSFKSEETGGSAQVMTAGIAVDKHNRVAVVSKMRTVTSLHNLDGSLILNIPNNGILPEYISASDNGRLIFTGYGIQKLRCVEMTGTDVFVVDTSVDVKKARPVGVCCDNAGDIYVTYHCGTEVGSSEVHHYDSQGVYVDCVAKGLCWPFGITFSPSGELVVADRHSVKILHRV